MQMQSSLEDPSPVCRSPETSTNSRKRSFDVSNGDAKDDNNQSFEIPSNQLVLYDPGTSGTCNDAPTATDSIENQTPSFRNFLAPSVSIRTLTSIGTFTVQCASCFKWRIIPTKEIYEKIREKILEEPFVCEHAREWRPEILCEDPEDISQDGSRLWAIDKPNIAQPPSGWERLLRIRGEGGTKFADVYYATPSGKRLRSMVEVQRYLQEHPEYAEGVTLSQFSFLAPRPLQENYVRKRPARSANSCIGGDPLQPRALESEAGNPLAVNPLAWAAPPHTDFLLGGPAPSSACHKEPVDSPPSEPPLPSLPPPPLPLPLPLQLEATPSSSQPPEPEEAVPSSQQIFDSSVHDQPQMKQEDADHSKNVSSLEL